MNGTIRNQNVRQQAHDVCRIKNMENRDMQKMESEVKNMGDSDEFYKTRGKSMKSFGLSEEFMNMSSENDGDMKAIIDSMKSCSANGSCDGAMDDADSKFKGIDMPSDKKFEDDDTSSDSDSSDNEVVLLTVVNLNKHLAMKLGKKAPGVDNFMDTLYNMPMRMKRALEKNARSNFTPLVIPRFLNPHFKPRTITVDFMTGSKWSVRSSRFISRTGEWSGKVEIPYAEDMINSIFLCYAWVTEVPDLAVLAVVKHLEEETDENKKASDTITATFQLIDDVGGAMPFPENKSKGKKRSDFGYFQDVKMSLQVISKLRDVSRNQMLQARNPDNTWNSGAINSLIDLMKNDRLEALSRSAFEENMTCEFAIKQMKQACRAGDAVLHVAME